MYVCIIHRILEKTKTTWEMSLLRDLWGSSGGHDGNGEGGLGGGGLGSGGLGDGDSEIDKNHNNGKMTFAQMVSSSFNEDVLSPTKAGRASWTPTKASHKQGGKRLSGAKRPRSPNEATCYRCFRSSHKTAECRHKVVCLRCACVGHMAARCLVVRSPHRKRLHVRSKIMSSSVQTEVQPEKVALDERQVKRWVAPIDGLLARVSFSLSLSPKIENIREDLSKVAFLSLIEGFVNESSVLEVAPTIINKVLAGLIIPLDDCCFLVLLFSREEVKDVCKLDCFKVATKDGSCTLK